MKKSNKVPHYEFGNRVRTRREDLGLTQQELADRVNVSLKTLQNWDRGVNTPKQIKDLLSLCNQLHCDPDYLLLRDLDTPRRATTDIIRATGLSESAVYAIEHIESNAVVSMNLKIDLEHKLITADYIPLKPILSAVLSSKYFTSLLINLANYRYYKMLSSTEPSLSDAENAHNKGTVLLSGEKAAEFALLESFEDFKKLARSMPSEGLIIETKTNPLK